MEKKTIILMLFVVTSVVATTCYNAYKDDVFEVENKNSEDSTKQNEHGKIVVYIEGAVAKPGIIFLNSGATLGELIELSGGLLANADTKKLNLDETIEDGQKITIYPRRMNNINENAELININTATIEELQKLPRIGPSTAKKIIEYREQNGKFNTIEELKNVSRIGEKTFEKLKDKIKV